MNELRWYWEGNLRYCDDCEEEVIWDEIEYIFVCTGCKRTSDR